MNQNTTINPRSGLKIAKPCFYDITVTARVEQEITSLPAEQVVLKEKNATVLSKSSLDSEKTRSYKKEAASKRWHGVLSWVYRRLRRWCGFRRLSSLALKISCRRQRPYGMAWFDYECYRPCEYYTR